MRPARRQHVPERHARVGITGGQRERLAKQALLRIGGAGDEPADVRLECRHRRRDRQRAGARRGTFDDVRGHPGQRVEERGSRAALRRQGAQRRGLDVDDARGDRHHAVSFGDLAQHDGRGAGQLGDLDERGARQGRRGRQLQAVQRLETLGPCHGIGAARLQQRRQSDSHAFAEPADARVEPLEFEGHDEQALGGRGRRQPHRHQQRRQHPCARHGVSPAASNSIAHAHRGAPCARQSVMDTAAGSPRSASTRSTTPAT
jgi:hypothetical protein